MVARRKVNVCRKIQLPNTFIIGAPKSGTTSLAAYLSNHPQAFLPKTKEPNYWTKETPKDNEDEYAKSWAGYKELYIRATEDHTVRIDGSTAYCWSDYSVRDILNTLPDSRFIFMIRNPVELAPSLHSEEMLSGYEDVPDYNDAWKLQGEREQGRYIPSTCGGCWKKVTYRFVASLGSHLDRLSNIIPKDQLHVILFDDFIRDPRREYLRTLEFLKLPGVEPLTYPIHNAAKHHLAPALSRAILRPQGPFKSVALAAKRTLYGLGIKGVRSGLVKVFVLSGRASVPNKQTIAEMKDYFEPEIELLEALLHRNLSLWR